MQLFLDCDRVLADFDALASTIFKMHPRDFEDLHGSDKFWELLEDHGSFYEELPLMHDARFLWDSVAHMDPIILTGCPKGGWAEDQKVRWAKNHFGSDVKLITCKSRHKREHMIKDKTNIIIDDWPHYKHLWEEYGGHFILHTDARSSLQKLQQILY